MGNIFFSSDSHWGHNNVVRFCSRPFESVHHMDLQMIQRWNEIVKPNDEVYYLGDLTLSTNKTYVGDILNSLKGKIHFIKGNHDAFLKKRHYDSRFETIRDYHELNINNRKIILCHYPILSWRNQSHGSWHLQGHSHSNMNEKNKDLLRLDIGVDNFNYYPVSLEEVSSILTKRQEEIKELHRGDYPNA